MTGSADRKIYKGRLPQGKRPFQLQTWETKSFRTYLTSSEICFHFDSRAVKILTISLWQSKITNMVSCSPQTDMLNCQSASAYSESHFFFASNTMGTVMH